MIKKYTLKFHESDTPIQESVTKFGGQPVWVAPPQWPLSRMTRTPMQFIGQIRLYPEIFGEIDAQMAYLFMSYDLNKYGGFPETWDPEEGENAVILQPGIWEGPSESKAEGPYTGACTSEELWWNGGYPPPPARKEYTVDLIAGEDPDEYLVPEDLLDRPKENDAHFAALIEAKIGGTPIPDYLTENQFPSSEEWSLLLQISQPNVPFEVNFGTDGIGTVFLSKDGKRAFLSWRR